jgi:hypothetical protein
MSRDKHWIDLAAASKLTAQWRQEHPQSPKAMGFDRAALDRILKQEGCVGIRCYYAKHDGGNWTLVLVGTDAEGRDMAKGEIAQEARPCPPDCDLLSPLHGDR